MSGSLGDLVVSLSCDVARFQADMGKSNKIAQDTMSRMQQDVSSGLKSVEGLFKTASGVIGGAMAVLAGGAMFKATIDTTKEVAGEITKLSRSLGITAEQASVLRIGLDDAFMTADDMTGAASRLTKQLGKNEEAFTDLGVSTRDSNGHFRSTVDIMTDVNSKLSKFKEGTDRNIEGVKIYGKGWDEARKMLKLTSEAMVEAKARAEELHLIFGDSGLKQVKEYRLAMKDIDDVFESIKVQLGMALIPELTHLAVAMGESAVKGIPAFISGMHSTQAEITRMAMLADKAGGSLTAMMYYTTGGKFTDTGKWWAEQNKMYEQRYKENDKMLQTLANAEVGLDADGNRPKASKAPAADMRSGGGAEGIKAAAAEAEALRIEFNKGVQGYNKLVDTFNAGRDDLSALQKAIAKVNEEVATLSREHPEQAADAARMGDKITKQLQLAEARKVENAVMKQSIELMEEANRTGASFKGLGSGLSIDFLQLSEFNKKYDEEGRAIKPRPLFSLDGNTKKQNYSLTGAAESSGFMGTSPLVTESEAEKKELLKLQKDFEKDMFEVKADAAQSALGLAKQAAGDNKGMLITVMLTEKALAIARIMQHTEVAAAAAIAAYAAIPGGVAAGAAQAAAIRSMSGVSIGMVAASGLMEGMQIAGKRAIGGPVTAGQTYLVGEKGPELMTAGANGYVTPNNKLGGGGVSIINNNDFRGADPATEQRMTAQIKANGEKVKADILNSMNRGGTFAMASGRR